MRICQIMLSAGYGGAERLFVDLCVALARAGHPVQAICHPDFRARDQIQCPGVRIDTLKARWDRSPLARFNLSRAIRRFAPHVIHSHLARGAALAGPVGKWLNIPVLANLHNYVKLKYYRHVSHFCPGTADQRRYLIRHGVASKSVTVIPHFSRLPVARETAPHSMDNTPPVFLSYGRFVEKKGFHLLIESISILRKTGMDARLILGGDGPERRALQALIAMHGLESCVTLCGWVADVTSFLEQSPYFVLPSLDEPFGIAVLEAMARGKVIVASKTKGPLEILDKSVAYLFETGDKHDLARALLAAISSGRARDKAKAALDRYKNDYSPERIVPRYEALFRQLRTGNKIN